MRWRSIGFIGTFNATDPGVLVLDGARYAMTDADWSSMARAFKVQEDGGGLAVMGRVQDRIGILKRMGQSLPDVHAPAPVAASAAGGGAPPPAVPPGPVPASLAVGST